MLYFPFLSPNTRSGHFFKEKRLQVELREGKAVLASYPWGQSVSGQVEFVLCCFCTLECAAMWNGMRDIPVSEQNRDVFSNKFLVKCLAPKVIVSFT